MRHKKKYFLEDSGNEAIPLQALILKVTALRGKKEIYTLFTKQLGMVSCVYQKQFAPFQEVEVLIKIKEEGLSTCYQMELLDPHLGLRSSFQALEAAAGIISCLSQRQMPLAPNEQLFDAARLFLKKMGDSKSPKTLLGAFLLKYLRMEGLLGSEFPHFNEKEKVEAGRLLNANSFDQLENCSPPPDFIDKILKFFNNIML